MAVPSPDLKLEIKNLILKTLDIQNISPADIDEAKPLFGGGNTLTLDSVDAIEIIMAIQRTYGIRIADQVVAREVVRSVNSMSQFIAEQQANHSS
ncbi:MAG: phosphopantetheine-binding protein [Bacteroidota bacterium]